MLNWFLAGVAVLCALFYVIGWVCGFKTGYEARVQEEAED